MFSELSPPEEGTQYHNSSTLRSEWLIAVSSQNTHFSQVLRKDYGKGFILKNISVIAERKYPKNLNQPNIPN